jgi:hypothetical protein
MRLPWQKAPEPTPPRVEWCAVGGCGNAATHSLFVEAPPAIAGDMVYLALCDDCDLTVKVRARSGMWQPLDVVTPSQIQEDLLHLNHPSLPSEYAHNVVLPSGRSWRFVGP